MTDGPSVGTLAPWLLVALIVVAFWGSVVAVAVVLLS